MYHHYIKLKIDFNLMTNSMMTIIINEYLYILITGLLEEA